MNDLTPEDEALLDLARGGYEPTADQRSRSRARLIGRLGIAAGLTTGTVATTTSAAAGTATVATTATAATAATAAATTTTAAATVTGIAGTSGALLAAGKVLASIALVGAVGAGGVASYRAVQRPTAAMTIASPPPPPTPPSARIPVLAPVAAPISAPLAEATAAITPAVVEPVPAVVSAPSARSSLPAAPRSTLEAEASLVRDGVTALHSGQPARALSSFDEHARRFPHGELAEERSAERIFALCDLGRTDQARSARASFLATYKGSPMMSRVEASCGGSSNP